MGVYKSLGSLHASPHGTLLDPIILKISTSVAFMSLEDFRGDYPDQVGIGTLQLPSEPFTQPGSFPQVIIGSTSEDPQLLVRRQPGANRVTGSVENAVVHPKR